MTSRPVSDPEFEKLMLETPPSLALVGIAGPCKEDSGEVEVAGKSVESAEQEFDDLELRFEFELGVGNGLLGMRGVEGFKGDALLEGVNSAKDEKIEFNCFYSETLEMY